MLMCTFCCTFLGVKKILYFLHLLSMMKMIFIFESYFNIEIINSTVIVELSRIKKIE